MSISPDSYILWPCKKDFEITLSIWTWKASKQTAMGNYIVLQERNEQSQLFLYLFSSYLCWIIFRNKILEEGMVEEQWNIQNKPRFVL